ncbi:uncharacterized protein F5147DRAFT_652946 [Suillus discolor]|uniref:Uncharacterized protein n=1 Tax=Suillus discolor TaxID=1912936 RepID=A0A9P7F7B5_9AGAM|nr:uncharacterized protein F5147DRAFT_652946 [Suillus discolor]KAG2108224.1 hypothetical protein F5147DRAFT_652946 [Suillus discolor]
MPWLSSSLDRGLGEGPFDKQSKLLHGTDMHVGTLPINGTNFHIYLQSPVAFWCFIHITTGLYHDPIHGIGLTQEALACAWKDFTVPGNFPPLSDISASLHLTMIHIPLVFEPPAIVLQCSIIIIIEPDDCNESHTLCRDKWPAEGNPLSTYQEALQSDLRHAKPISSWSQIPIVWPVHCTCIPEFLNLSTHNGSVITRSSAHTMVSGNKDSVPCDLNILISCRLWKEHLTTSNFQMSSNTLNNNEHQGDDVENERCDHSHQNHIVEAVAVNQLRFTAPAVPLTGLQVMNDLVPLMEWFLTTKADPLVERIFQTRLEIVDRDIHIKIEAVSEISRVKIRAMHGGGIGC